MRACVHKRARMQVRKRSPAAERREGEAVAERGAGLAEGPVAHLTQGGGDRNSASGHTFRCSAQWEGDVSASCMRAHRIWGNCSCRAERATGGQHRLERQAGPDCCWRVDLRKLQCFRTSDQVGREVGRQHCQCEKRARRPDCGDSPGEDLKRRDCCTTTVMLI